DGGISLGLTALIGFVRGVIDPRDECRLSADQVGELIGDRRQHLDRRRTAGHQGGHPPQRRLLIGKLAQPCLAVWIMVDSRFGGTVRCARVWRIHTAGR
ncbi:MAG: hypothetical protein QOJ37_1801, partial [Pseudonocardiales bacterium]|nr:hypothetical protein [Pseudonocardiales bacterium]